MIRPLIALCLAVLAAGCSSKNPDYDWQRPHDTYQVGAFDKSQNAENLKSRLKQAGFDSRVETEIVNGAFYLNVLVDVYQPQPDTLSRLEAISGSKPIPRNKKSAAGPGSPAKPAAAKP